MLFLDLHNFIIVKYFPVFLLYVWCEKWHDNKCWGGMQGEIVFGIGELYPLLMHKKSTKNEVHFLWIKRFVFMLHPDICPTDILINCS
jgi:hypothetical protein